VIFRIMVLGGKSRQIFGFKVLIRKVLWNKGLVTNSKRSVPQRLEAAVDSAVFDGTSGTRALPQNRHE
jgi:hypothetical protein